MEIRQLRYFLSVVREGSVSAAARTHFVTQPAVSLQLRRLEEEVGETLFDRRSRRMIPTEMGRILTGHAEEVLRSLDALEGAVAGVRGLESGRLRMGNIDAASIYVLPEVYREFHERYPGVTMEIVVGDTRQLLDALARGDVELATTKLPIDDGSLMANEIYREHFVAVAGVDHPLCNKARISARELTESGIITYPAGSTTRRLIESAFRARGHDLRPRMEISSPEAMKRLAQAGLGVTILPRPVVAEELEQGSLVELTAGLHIERSIGMVHRGADTLSPAARVFLEMVENRFKGKEAD
jgi:DNA-binding transcriptional LysR family regulator